MSASKSKQSYIIVMGIEPMTVGDVYKHELHSTLVHWFYSERSIEQITDLIEPIVSSTQPLKLQSGEVADFGKGEDLPANLIIKSEELKTFHDRIRQALATVDVEYLEPRYIGEGWRPHVTWQGSKSLPEGQSVIIKAVYLVECPNGPEKHPIMVRAKLELGNENPA